MKNKRFWLYYVLSCLGVLAAAAYPITMGVRVAADMLRDGSVLKENYPKYVIPYTPLGLALLIGLILMPLFIRLLRRYALPGGTALAVGVFLVLERLLENSIVVTGVEQEIKLEDWQMFMCYVPPESTVTTYKTQTAVEILMGEYDPAFKLHFYLISIVLLAGLLNVFYGFATCILAGQRRRLRALTMQAVSTGSFLGLCILACFTAFWRDGSLQVSALSAVLMAVFFILFGVTFGILAGSFLLGKSKPIAVWLPALLASATTLGMYAGELALLNGHVYQLGEGLLFRALPGIPLAAADVLIILAAGLLTAWLMLICGKERRPARASDT